MTDSEAWTGRDPAPYWAYELVVGLVMVAIWLIVMTVMEDGE